MNTRNFFPRRIPEPARMQSHEDRVYGAVARDRFRAWFVPIVDDVVAKIGTPQGKVLDVACGPGLLAKAFGMRSQRFSVIAVDVSPVAVRIARKNCRGLSHVRILCASALSLPFDTGAMDVVVCRDSLHHFSRPDSALREMTRVLKRGGLLYIQDLRRNMPARLLRQAFPRETVFQRLQWYSARASYTKEEIEAFLRKLPLVERHVSTRHVTKTFKKKFIRNHGSLEGIRDSFQAHVIATGYKQ